MQSFPSNGTLNTPPSEDFTNTSLQGSMQNILQDNLGAYVQIEFLLGTQGMTARLGVLYAVGTGYVVLYDVGNSNYLVCDIFSIKFVTFFSPDGQSGYIFPMENMQSENQNTAPQNLPSQSAAVQRQSVRQRPMRR